MKIDVPMSLVGGTPVLFKSKTVCPNCWAVFTSISTKTRKTRKTTR